MKAHGLGEGVVAAVTPTPNQKTKKNNERFQRKNVKRILLFFWMIIDVYSLNQHHSRSFFIGIDS